MVKQAMKVGARNSAKDGERLQQIHDLSVQNGAMCDTDAASKSLPAVKLMLAALEANPEYAEQYARQELWDINTAASAIMNLSSGLGTEMDEPADAKKVFDLIRGLCDFIMSECDEGEKASAMGDSDEEVGDDEPTPAPIAMRSTGYQVYPEGGWTKKQMEELAGGKVDRDKLKESSFVFPDERAFPVTGAGDISDAVSAWGRYKGKHSFEDFKKRLTALAKAKGWEGSLPKEWKDKESKSLWSVKLDTTYAKALRIQIPAERLAVKFIGRDTIVHPVFLWGSANLTDVEADFFVRPGTEKGTNLWDDKFKSMVRPLTWDHNQDELFPEPSPVIGETKTYHDDEYARWAESVLNKDRKYRKYIDQFIEQHALGTSSDSAPQYVDRVPQGKGQRITEWPWFASALTPTPAEPRMKDFAPEFIKSLLIDPADADAVRRRDFMKMRREALELRNRK